MVSSVAPICGLHVQNSNLAQTCFEFAENTTHWTPPPPDLLDVRVLSRRKNVKTSLQMSSR